MKKIKLLLLLITISNYCFSQTTCNLSGLAKEVRQSIDQDKKKPDNIFIIEQLTLSVKYESMKEREVAKAHHIFSYNAGFTFRFYVLSSNSKGNNATLKLYKRSEDDSIPNILLTSITDKSGDKKASILEYRNNQSSDFYLELSLEKNKPGCAAAMVAVYPNK